ncbi:urate hydroxylase PuuD [Ahrensia sp. R2A130]|uniref:urate hydroxylase PuuD n=1 Tax=Ahrensia sp. R2A130 TaxID=744979 RepID=UPI0001E0D0EC|nr:urate hydroxylase PuuD [Ahrensia sp. R2A130]EFL89269.1 membrane protein [Ahrensia sp. R2A130]
MYYDYAVMWDWLSFGVRWLHVITAMAWIGASFYFIALDLMLKPADDMPEGASGEEWEVHGGGFYHTTKYLVAPARLPEHLTWHKWQSYITWVSGVALLAIVYWAGAELYLIDRNVADLAVWQAIALSAGSLAIGWIIYDFLCKSPIGANTNGLMVLLFVLLVIMGWGYTQIFTGRAAFLHLGAFTATIMTANVFVIIMPNQRIVVADLKAGRKPDPKYGKIAKQRSMHNNYLTLPVLFLMLSNHYPLAFGTEYNWIIAAQVFLMGVTIRHYFNTMHATGKGPSWTWLATAILFVVAAWLSTNPKFSTGEAQAATSARVEQFMAAPGFQKAAIAVQGRCAMCHADEPTWEGMIVPPKGVVLQSDQDVARHAREIYLQAGRSIAMPPGNLSEITDDERVLIVEWYEAAVSGQSN